MKAFVVTDYSTCRVVGVYSKTEHIPQHLRNACYALQELIIDEGTENLNAYNATVGKVAVTIRESVGSPSRAVGDSGHMDSHGVFWVIVAAKDAIEATEMALDKQKNYVETHKTAACCLESLKGDE
jgi:hypothetical protein